MKNNIIENRSLFGHCAIHQAKTTIAMAAIHSPTYPIALVADSTSTCCARNTSAALKSRPEYTPPSPLPRVFESFPDTTTNERDRGVSKMGVSRCAFRPPNSRCAFGALNGSFEFVGSSSSDMVTMSSLWRRTGSEKTRGSRVWVFLCAGAFVGNVQCLSVARKSESGEAGCWDTARRLSRRRWSESMRIRGVLSENGVSWMERNRSNSMLS
ncbi:hypothetical protein BC830DRAFT_889716 [Chytriomyces sp. MP71]|nr:hypothetical protein BC830DRAFT_889716 [Chytriomyces sp. MP71]